MRERRNCTGYSLIGLLTVLTLIGLIQALAAPALSGVVNSIRLRTGVDALFSSLLLTRSEAIKRNARVVVCKSGTGDACTSNGGWEQGWIVFHDANNNGVVDPGEAVLRREPALSPGVRFTGNSPVSKYVSYTPAGKTHLISGAFQAGTFTICTPSSSPVEAHQIVINSSGRPRLAKTVVNQCL